MLTDEKRLEGSLARLAAIYSEGGLTDEDYRGARDIQRRRLEALRARIARAAGKLAPRPDELTEEELIRLSGVTPELWALLPAQAQRDIYRLLFECVEVNPRPTQPRIRIRWK